MTDQANQPSFKNPAFAMAVGFSIFVVQLLVIGSVFKHGIDFECRANWPKNVCISSSGILVSIYGLIAAFVLFGILFRSSLSKLVEQAGHQVWPLLLSFGGLVIAMIPVLFLKEGTGSSMLIPTLACWTIGMGTLLAGIALFMAPAHRWADFVQTHGTRLVPLLLGGIAAPLLATIIRPIWQLDAIAGATFGAVSWAIGLLGYQVDTYPEHRIIGFDGFFIDIAPVCSGIEGIALVTIFASLYLYLFRSELRFPRAFLLYPIGMIVSASLNIVRIVVLMVIGLEGNPELAVGGFHSHAGWLMFTIVSLGIIAAANTIPWLRKDGAAIGVGNTEKAPVQPFFRDPVVAHILPFAIFMLSAMLAQAFSQSPGVIYPARALLMAGVLVMFLPVYRALNWRFDLVAVGIGAAIGVMWVLIPVAEPDTTPPYGELAGIMLVLWFVARGIGTTVLVPVIEELFFRGYLESKLRRHDNLIWAIGAAVVIAVLFALLHSRWAEAFIASLAFSYVMYRSGRVTDAIVSHGVANAIVFGVALATGQMHII